MGSISTDKKTGQKRYLYYDKNDQKCSIWLGDVTLKAAESFQRFVDRILEAQLMNVSFDAETARWLGDLPEKYYSKLVLKGFVQPRRKVATLGECIPRLIEARAPSVSGQTIEIWRQSEESLYRFFSKNDKDGKGRKVDSITRIEAESFRSWLVSDGRLDGKGGLRPTTVWKRLQHVVSFFGTLVKEGEITQNPFEDLTMSPVVNEDRNAYVDEKFIYQFCPMLNGG